MEKFDPMTRLTDNKGKYQHLSKDGKKEDYKAGMEGLSYDAMMYEEGLRHPRQVVNSLRIKFNTCAAKLGNIALSPEERAITEAEQELGIGMAIYFRQMKFFSLIFFILTIVSLPSYLIYSSGPFPAPLTQFLFRFSLSNLG